MGLIARTEVTNRVEDYNVGFFSYEIKVYLIDFKGVGKGEGVGITNTREGKNEKTNGYAVQNTVLKMAKKRALVDATLNVGNLSARFTQDIEDMNIELDNVGGKKYDAYIIPNGIEDYSYMKDGEKKSGKQFKFAMDFPKKKEIKLYCFCAYKLV